MRCAAIIAALVPVTRLGENDPATCHVRAAKSWLKSTPPLYAVAFVVIGCLTLWRGAVLLRG